MFNYLPSINSRILYEQLLTKSWGELEHSLSDIRYERVGIDRLLTIMLDIEQTYGRMQGFKFLDVGCNNGFFSNGIAAFGNKVCGLDNYAINNQKVYDELEIEQVSAAPNVKLNNCDILNFLKENKGGCWDFVLLLSVAHQWEFGYAKSGECKFSNSEIKFIMNNLFNNANYAVYYECPFDEPGFDVGYGFKFLERYLDNIENFRISLIDETVGSNGYSRHLFRVERRY